MEIQTIGPREFEKLVRRHLVVRVLVEPVKTKDNLPDSAVRYSISTCLFHEDHERTVFLNVGYTYADPCSDSSELERTYVQNIWHQLENERWLKMGRLLSRWSEVSPRWLFSVPHIVHNKVDSNHTPVAIGEFHILQALARFQVAVVITAGRDRLYQSPLLELSMSIGDLIVRKNRNREMTECSSICTPLRQGRPPIA